jgi:hypothetical protein
MVTIAIIGCDHCGSTILARLLATGPEVWCGGELHRLVDIEPVADRSCQVHGNTCPVLTPAFLARRDLDLRTVYQELLVLSGKNVIISTDKDPAHYRRFLRLSTENIGIVLFKDPQASFLSQVTTKKLTPTAAIQVYLDLYREVIDWAPRFFSRLAWVDHNSLLARPFNELARLQVKLDLDLRLTGALAVNYCYVGGNESAHQQTELFRPGTLAQYVARADINWPEMFAPLRASRESFDLYQQLRSKMWL